MRVWIYLGIAACLAGMATAVPVAILSSRNAGAVKVENPEDVRATNGVFASDYFGLSYRVPAGLTEGLAGPGPSQSGYYVLGTWVQQQDYKGSILIAAQDMFFAAGPSDDVKNVVVEARQVMSSVEGMTIDREP